MKITIGVVVGNNGDYSAGQPDGDGKFDWPFLEDCCSHWDEKDQDVVYPDVTRRYVVSVDVETPSVSPPLVAGNATVVVD